MKTKFYDLGVTGCSDGSCIFQDNSKGMHTNGGCNCCRSQHKVLRALNTQEQQIESLRATISRLLEVSSERDFELMRLQDRVAARDKTISRLREYAKHRYTCHIGHYNPRTGGDHTCNCGYDELMKELGEGK